MADVSVNKEVKKVDETISKDLKNLKESKVPEDVTKKLEDDLNPVLEQAKDVEVSTDALESKVSDILAELYERNRTSFHTDDRNKFLGVIARLRSEGK